MKIADIEVIPVTIPLAARYDNHAGRMRMCNIDQHVIVKVHTDNGLVGYGDNEDATSITDGEIEPLIGRNPFDFLLNDFNIALGMALYDVMGKYLEVPAYKLMGQKVRDAAPCAAWTRPCGPEVFAQEVARAADQGYRVFKMHSNAQFDVLEQTAAAAEVAPPGFRLHWDCNHNRSIGVIMPIIKEFERNHPIVGYIEDPLVWTDIEGWRRIREKTSIPIIMHVPQLGGIQEVIAGVADIYMMGGPIGKTIQSGFAYGKANVQALLQQSGGTLMKAFTLHQAAVLPTASVHLITLDDQYDRDIAQKIAVEDGFSRVPEGPGLGVEVDDDTIAEFAAMEPLPRPEFIGVLHLPSGRKHYSRGGADVARITGQQEGDLRGIDFERWVDDGSPEYARVKDRLDNDGAFFE